MQTYYRLEFDSPLDRWPGVMDAMTRGVVADLRSRGLSVDMVDPRCIIFEHERPAERSVLWMHLAGLSRYIRFREE